MSRLLLVAFDDADALQGAGFSQTLGVPWDLLMLAGEGFVDLGAEKVLRAGFAEIPPADALAGGLVPIASVYSHVAAVSSMRSKDLLARFAGLVQAAMVTDAIAVESPTVFKRPIVAGSAIATVEAL